MEDNFPPQPPHIPRDLANHPITHRTALTAKNYADQNANSSEVEKYFLILPLPVLGKPAAAKRVQEKLEDKTSRPFCDALLQNLRAVSR